jgi:hypothetical protein
VLQHERGEKVHRVEAEPFAHRLTSVREVREVFADHGFDVLCVDGLLQVHLLVHGLGVDVLLDALDVLAGLLDVLDKLRTRSE